MWVAQIFSLILLVLVACHGLPMKNLEESMPNAIVSIAANEHIGEHVKNPEIRHAQVVQSKPRILVSYGNVYKPAPIDPVQNLLMYFLMNAARDFGQDQDQFDRRRSPNFFADAKAAVSDVTGKVVNGSKKIGQKFEETRKTITSREIPIESQYEETHFYPHIDGTCMCFNRLIRHGSLELKNDDFRGNFINGELKENNELATTEKKIKDSTEGQLKDDKTTELKIDKNNIPVMEAKGKSTTSAENSRFAKENNTVVRVLKVFDFDNLDAGKINADTTTAVQRQSTLEV